MPWSKKAIKSETRPWSVVKELMIRGGASESRVMFNRLRKASCKRVETPAESTCVISLLPCVFLVKATLA